MWILKNSIFQLLLLALAASCVFAAGLSGSFYFDDEWNVLRNSALQIDTFGVQELWRAALSGEAGPLGRPLATLSFAVNYLLSGFDPYYFKLTNLLIHITCGVLVYAVALLLSEQIKSPKLLNPKFFAFLVSALWLLHPINLTPVLYVVQRMTSLSTLFCLLGMLSYIQARLSVKQQKPRAIGFLFVTYLICFPLGLLSKENAALLPAYCFLIELLFFRFRAIDSGALCRPIVGLHTLLVFVPGALILLYLLVMPEWVLGGYARRDFSMLERVLTESRVLVFYLGQILLPLNSELALFHDDMRISTSLFAPLTTFFSIMLIVGLLLIGFLQRDRWPVVAFSILFFFCAHLLESTILALELVHEHRNYLASFSVLFGVAYALTRLFESDAKKGFMVIVLVVSFLGVTTAIRAAVWGNSPVQAWQEVIDHPDSPRANYEIGKRYAIYANGLDDSQQKQEAVMQAGEYFEKSSLLRESYTDGLFGLLMLEGIEGRPIGQTFREMLLTRLATGPFNNNNYNYLNAVFNCIEMQECDFQDSVVDKIMLACQRNPSFSGPHSRALLEKYNQYTSQP